MNSRTRKSLDKIKKVSGRKELVKKERKGWEEFFSIYSGHPAKINFEKSRPFKIDTDDDIGTVVTLNEEDKLSHILHDAYQLKDRLLLKDLQEIPELSEALSLPFVAENFEILRNAQVDWHASKWFNKDVFEAQAREVRRRLRRKRTQQPCPAGVANAVYDVNSPVKLDLPAETAIRICYYDILQSRESDDAFEPLKAAIELGKIIRDLNASMPPSPLQPKSLQKKQKGKQVQFRISTEEKTQIKPSPDNGAEAASENEEFKDLDDTIEKVRQKHDKNQRSKPEDRTRQASPLSSSEEADELGHTNSHEYRIDHLRMVRDIQLRTTLRRMIGELTANGGSTRMTRSGMVTPKAWQINLGEIKVFTKPPFSLKRVVVMVDLSDSMGCWCEACCERSGFAEGKSKAWMALQLATAIGKAFPDTTDMFGFSSDHQFTYIYPLQIGREPVCRRMEPIAVGTPLCVALKHLEETSLSLDATMAVLITDGDPGTPAPLSTEHLRKHTRELSEELYLRGLRYCTVMVGDETGKQLFPVATAIRIRVPSEFYRLQEILVKLSEDRWGG
jgi:hypothetical protein